MSGKRWGRWQLVGNHLVYCPDPGGVDPVYDVDTSCLDGAETIEGYVDHCSEKSWVRPEDLTNLAEACRSIFWDRFPNEQLLPVPQAMSRTEYENALAEEWRAFLCSADPKDEMAFQQFLERHPVLLPGPYGTTRGMYHGPIHQAVYTQPELPGVRAKRPDFLLLEQDSATVHAVLIEIEAPGKPWCTSRGTPSALLTQAVDQLRDWKAWFSKPANVIAFQDLYAVAEEIDDRRFVQHYVLIYGRREEANRFKSFAAKRHALASQDEFLMTYDRLNPTGAAGVTVRLDRSGPDTRLRAVCVPPTFRLERYNAHWFTSFLGGDEAIRNMPFVSEARRGFLLERLPVAEAYIRRAASGALDSWNTWP